MTDAEAAALFERRRSAWVDGDVDAYLALWHPDVEFASPVHDPPIRGRAAYAALVHRSHETVRPVAFEVHALAVRGALVLAEWTITIARRADDRMVSWHGMSRCELRDGLIVSWREYWNPAELAAAG